MPGRRVLPSGAAAAVLYLKGKDHPFLALDENGHVVEDGPRLDAFVDDDGLDALSLDEHFPFSPAVVARAHLHSQIPHHQQRLCHASREVRESRRHDRVDERSTENRSEGIHAEGWRECTLLHGLPGPPQSQRHQRHQHRRSIPKKRQVVPLASNNNTHKEMVQDTRDHAWRSAARHQSWVLLSDVFTSDKSEKERTKGGRSHHEETEI
jgi:hypothetical protein